MTPEESANRWRYGAIALGLIVGGVLVAFGLLDGNAWASLAGGVLSGGAGVAVVKR